LRSYDIQRKSIHITVTDDMHSAFKGACARERLTMQEFLEECISRLLDEDEDIVKVAKEISRGKSDRTIKRITQTDADAVYRAINGG